MSAGLWAGITLGRFVLSRLAHMIEEKLSIVVLVIGSAALPRDEAHSQCNRRRRCSSSRGFTARTCVPLRYHRVQQAASPIDTGIESEFHRALGSSGGAVSPFFTGLLTQKVGSFVLHPICVGLYGEMLAGWTYLPRISKRDLNKRLMWHSLHDADQ